jgi:hypothetical protein
MGDMVGWMVVSRSAVDAAGVDVIAIPALGRAIRPTCHATIPRMFSWPSGPLPSVRATIGEEHAAVGILALGPAGEGRRLRACGPGRLDGVSVA